ncbi:MAG: FAD-binding oxidoreductase [Thermomicrobiales bacterium]
MKSQADVVVIGGGIMGSAIAYYLANRKTDVVLLEKGTAGGEQSTRAWGFVRQQGRDIAELPLAVAMNRIWPELAAELDADLEWTQDGVLLVADTEERLQQFREWVDASSDYGIGTQIVSGREIHELIPAMQGTFLGGMYTPSDGHAEPTKVPMAFTNAARRLGATIYDGCAATGIEVTAGRVTAVHTERGTIHTPIVVCAAGAWSSRLARMVGLELPQLVVRATVAETYPVEPVTGIGVAIHGDVAFRQRPNGSIYMSILGQSDHELMIDSVRYARWFMPNFRLNREFIHVHVNTALVRDIAHSVPMLPERLQGADPLSSYESVPARNVVEHARARLGTLIQALGNVPILRTWGGKIDMMPDAIPVIGAVDRPTGFILATGFSGHGFALGPIVGQVVSELILDNQPSIDLHALRFSRFAERDLAPARAAV